MRSLATTALLCGALSSGCGGCDGPQCDPAAIVADIAGPEATDCGSVEAGWDDLSTIEAAHDCVADALASASGFAVTLDQAVADGRIVVAYASDGTSIYRIDYTYVMSFVPPYIDSESIAASVCAELDDRGRDCGQLYQELCFECLDPQPAASERTSCD
jgi:hypothetical protein